MSNIYFTYYLNNFDNNIQILDVTNFQNVEKNNVLANYEDETKNESEQRDIHDRILMPHIITKALIFIQKEYGNKKRNEIEKIIMDKDFDYDKNINDCDEFIGIYLKNENNKIILYDKVGNTYLSGWFTSSIVPKIIKLGEFGYSEIDNCEFNDMCSRLIKKTNISLPRNVNGEMDGVVKDRKKPLALSSNNALSELKKFNACKLEGKTLKENLIAFNTK